MRSTGESPVARSLAPPRALGAALVTVALPFALLWRQVHAPYPHAFGRTVASIGVVVGVQAIVVGMARRHDPAWRWWIHYGLATATTCAAVALAALSRRILAEGQVTAMLLAVGLLLAGVVAAAVEAGTRATSSGVARRAYVVGTLVALAAVLAWRLPVVQFVDRARLDAIHPVHGSLYGYLAGVMTGLLAPEIGRRGGTIFVAVAFLTSVAAGYLLQSWFGAAVATIGISVAFGDVDESLKKTYVVTESPRL